MCKSESLHLSHYFFISAFISVSLSEKGCGNGPSLCLGCGEQFPEESRHSHPLYSAEALKIIGPVWISMAGKTDEAKLKVIPSGENHLGGL